MKVEMTDDLKELYETGQCKRYKDVSRNNLLLTGFARAIKIMEQVPSIDSLKEISFLHYVINCPANPLFVCQTNMYTGSFSRKQKMDFK